MNKPLLIFIVSILLPCLLSGQDRIYALPEGISSDNYSNEFIVVRLKDDLASQNIKGRSDNPLSGRETQRLISYIKESSKNVNFRASSHPLANIYTVKLNKNETPVALINKLLENENILYAEPHFNHKPLFIPDDPEAQPGGNQYYLTNISAYDAWTIEKGSEDIIIGILDTGVLPDYADLTDNIFTNTADPINGIDDDNDGLIDNLRGWDIADDDNNPKSDTDIHGHGVSGVSSASTNNGLDIAGVGYNSKFMPIKIFRSGSNSISNGYPAIALAADLGCQVINLSWGSANSFSQAGQDIINYAVEEKDAVVVAAAGNTNALLDFYPASFDNVLSVGASNIGDAKAGFATYSYKIDLMAPGESIYVTDSDSTFKVRQGTSYSSPMVAGAAALIRARFPDLTAKQVMERIRVNTDDIYSIAENLPYEGQLGSGRLNVFKALTNNISPSLRIEAFEYTNGVGQYAFFDDTLDISIDISNYLFAASNATATISSPSPYVEIINGEFEIGSLATSQSKNNFSQPFRVRLSEDLPPREGLIFRIDFEAGSYQDFQYITIESSPDYLTIDNGTIALTSGSSGELGYNMNIFSQGDGLKYQGQRLLDNIGLIITSDENTVKDTAPGFLPANIKDDDFEPLSSIRYYQNSEAPFDARSVFEDNPSLPDYLGVRVEQKILAWDGSDDDNFLIAEYRLVNISGLPINTLHTGLFADWNLNNRDLNEAGWDASNLLGYAKDPQSDTLYAGIALLTDQTPLYYAIDNKNANGNSADILSSIEDIDKYNLMSNGIAKTTAGINGGGNDISQIAGLTINNFNADDTDKLAFAIVSGSSLSELQTAATKAADKYQSYLDTPPLLYVTEVCLGDNAEIDPPSGTNFEFYSDVALTNLVFVGESYSTPVVTGSQTYYVVNKDQAFDGDIFRVMAKPKLVNADFSFSTDPLLLDETGETEVRMTDLSKDGVNWGWDFGNGFTSTVQHPIMNYAQIGSYDIQLAVISDIGCIDSLTKTLEVANRSNKPNIGDQNICKGDIISVSATNATNLRVFSNADLSNLIFSGTTFTTSSLPNDTTFYITSMDSVYESNAQKVKVITSKIKADFSYQLDTANLSQKQLLHFNNKSENETLYLWYINDQLQGNSTDISYDYSNDSAVKIKLLAEDINGCQDSITQIISPAVSPQPVVSNFNICVGDSVSISPSNGNVFLFYNDEALTNLIAKGSCLKFDSLLQDTTLYITSIDSLLESTAMISTIDVKEINASFSLSPDSLNISDINQLTINHNSTGADSYMWFVNDSLMSELDEPELVFDNVGTFEIKLLTSNNFGCISTESQNLIITNITGLTHPETSISVFPNPTYGDLYIKSPQPVDLRIMDLKGITHFYQSDVGETIIDMSDYPDGIYILETTLASEIFYKKIVKSSR